jgi:hypothetical protein
MKRGSILENNVRNQSLTGGRGYMRTLKPAVFGALASSAIALFGTLPAHAAVLSVGGANSPLTPFESDFICADVTDGSLTLNTDLQAFDCNAQPNQQFEFSDFTIFALGGQRCVAVEGNGTAAGTLVQSSTCNGSEGQVWYYEDGQFINPNSGKCLDATNGEQRTKLVINDCSDVGSQKWQIK